MQTRINSLESAGIQLDQNQTETKFLNDLVKKKDRSLKEYRSKILELEEQLKDAESEIEKHNKFDASERVG